MPLDRGVWQPNANGNIKVPCERYDEIVAGTSHDWVEVSSPEDGVQSLPNSGTQYTADDPDSPRIRYRVSLPNSGTWRLFARRSAPGGGADNTSYVSIDGEAASELGHTVSAFWGYIRDVSVASSGTTSVEFQMREDGAILHDFVLTQDGLLDAAGAESEPESTLTPDSTPTRRRNRAA